jgi:hypothetical protein
MRNVTDQACFIRCLKYVPTGGIYIHYGRASRRHKHGSAEAHVAWAKTQERWELSKGRTPSRWCSFSATTRAEDWKIYLLSADTRESAVLKVRNLKTKFEKLDLLLPPKA